MPRQIHGVMQNTDDLDYVADGSSVHDEMSPATPSPRDMKGTHSLLDFITRGAARHVRPPSSKASASIKVSR